MLKKGGKSIRKFKGYIYLIPAIIILGVFVFYPIIYTIINSFDTTRSPGFVFGFDNYVNLLTKNTIFMKSLLNTVIYAVIVPALSVFLSLLIANALANLKNEKMKSFFQSVYFLPYVTSLVAIGIVWSWLFNSEYGIINLVITTLGFEPIKWLTDSRYAMSALIIFAVWKSLAFNTLILTTGIASINPQYYQAAKIDQASDGVIFRKITIKLVSPMIVYTYIISLIAAFKVYTEAYVLFGDTTLNGSVSTVVRFIIDAVYNGRNYPLAFTASVILLVIILSVTMVQKTITRNKIHY